MDYLGSIAFAAIMIVMLIAMTAPGSAHWTGPTDPALHAWFDSLASGRGLCCSFADGVALDSPDWGTDAHGYWVMIGGNKIDVPPEAVVTAPNKYGQAVVWPYTGADGVTRIRCFMPGAGS